jgi:single-stranded DNA-specific DHH superfamily exonuclease
MTNNDAINKRLTSIREVLDNSVRPLIFFDDDCDGLTSFLMFYRYVGEGKGHIVKTAPRITKDFLKRVEEFNPDVLFILDIANVDQEFIDGLSIKIVWIDHHDLSDVKSHNLLYFNPKQYNPTDSQPTSYWCYKIIKDKHPEFLWLGTLGAVSDWFVPDYIDEFILKYPEYLDSVKPIGDILYATKLGTLYRAISFVIKGKTKDVHAAVSILTKLTHPDEILKQESARGKLLFKRYKALEKDYLRLLELAEKSVDKNIVLFRPPSVDTSFTSDLSNELMYRHPTKLIIIAREKGDEMKCSLRSNTVDLPKAIEHALIGLSSGYGGGHKKASGACVKRDDFDTFVSNLKKFILENS